MEKTLLRIKRTIKAGMKKDSSKAWLYATFCLSLLLSCNGKLGANKKQLLAKRQIEAIMPIRYEGFGLARSVDIENETITFIIRVEEEGKDFSIEKINRKKKLAKQIVNKQIAMMDEKVKSVLHSLAEKNYSLRIRIVGTVSPNNGIIELSAEELRIASSTKQNMQINDFKLEMVAMTTRIMLPTRIDELTEWVDTRLNSDSFEYVYNLDDSRFDLDSMDLYMLKEEQLTLLKDNIYYLNNVIHNCLETDRSIVITYLGKDSGKSISVTLNTDDIRNVYYSD